MFVHGHQRVDEVSGPVKFVHQLQLRMAHCAQGVAAARKAQLSPATGGAGDGPSEAPVVGEEEAWEAGRQGVRRT